MESNSKEVFLLELHENVHNIGDVFRLDKSSILSFTFGPSLLGHTVRLFTNYPLHVSDDTSSTSAKQECSDVEIFQFTSDTSNLRSAESSNSYAVISCQERAEADEISSKIQPLAVNDEKNSNVCMMPKPRVAEDFDAEKNLLINLCSNESEIGLTESHSMVPFELSFILDKFYEVPINRESGNFLRRHFNNIHLLTSGVFRYYFTLDGSDTWRNASGSGFFIVDPEICVGQNQSDLIPVDGVLCQTVVTKCLGKFVDWLPRIRVTKDSGYNAIHFTPMQELGPYGSSYAIKDQHKVNPSFYSPDQKEVTMNDIACLVTRLKEEFGLMSIADLVLNHTACESEWIKQHPECTYNLLNSPHLKPAFIIDRTIHRFMLEISENRWVERGIPSVISSEEQLQIIGRILRNELLPRRRIAEFYQADGDQVANEFRAYLINLHTTSGVNFIETNAVAVAAADIKLTADIARECTKATLIETTEASKYTATSADGICETAQAAVAATPSTKATAEYLANSGTNCYVYGNPHELIHQEFDNKSKNSSRLELIYDRQYRRFKASVDLSVAAKLFHHPTHSRAESLPIMDQSSLACARLLQCVRELNAEEERRVSDDLNAAVQNFISDCRDRLNSASHNLNVSSLVSNKISWIRYFVNILELHDTDPVSKHSTLTQTTPTPASSLSSDLPEESDMYEPSKACYWMAHSGWLDNQAPLVDFAGEAAQGRVYMRRELHSWTDSVKLRYGNHPSECPVLWQHMRDYVRETVSIFQGVRLDNLHTTPLHVGEWMMKEARKVRPDLYVIAELITDSSLSSALYTNHLGITAIIRNLYHLKSAGELSGALCSIAKPIGSFIQPNDSRRLLPCPTRYIFYDQTHDDPSPLSQNSSENSLCVTAAVCMGAAGVASNRGYDELVPYNISIIDEYRLFRGWTDAEGKDCSSTDEDSVRSLTGLISSRQVLTRYHKSLLSDGFTQIYSDQPSLNLIAITRHNPKSHESVVCIAYTCYGKSQSRNFSSEISLRNFQCDISPMKFPGMKIQHVLFEMEFVNHDPDNVFVDSVRYITGLSDCGVNVHENLETGERGMITVRDLGEEGGQILFNRFTPGCVVAFRLTPNKQLQGAIEHIHETLSSLGYSLNTSPNSLTAGVLSEIRNIVNDLTTQDIYEVFFETDFELHYQQHRVVRSADKSPGYGVYSVPGVGDLVHYGLQGVIPLLREIRVTSNLNHPLCRNLREGDWMLDYIIFRLNHQPSTCRLADFLCTEFDSVRRLPRHLVPMYFDAYVRGISSLMIDTVLQRDISEGDRLLFESMGMAL